MLLRGDARSLCPPPAQRGNALALADFKAALAAQYGVDVGFEIYRSMLALPNWGPPKRVPIESLRDYAGERALYFSEVYPAGEPFAIPPPKVIGHGDHRTLRGTARSFFVACLAGARVENESLMIETDGIHLLDHQGGELAGNDDVLELVPRVFAASDTALWMMPDRQEEIAVDEAFGSLLGRASSHFGHWLWEFLPKYVTALASGKLPPEVPVLRRAFGVPEQLKEALDLLLPSGTQVIEVPPVPVRVKRLWCAPSLMYAPYWDSKLTPAHRGNDDQCFPAERFDPMLDAMRGIARDAGSGAGIERVFVARRNEIERALTNGAAIEDAARARGFTVVYPEDLPFADQVRVARDARFVVGPQGSGMFLNFFARPGTKACILSHQFLMMPLTYCYLLQRAGIDVTILTGPAALTDLTKDVPLANSADFSIDPRTFALFLDGWLEA